MTRPPAPAGLPTTLTDWRWLTGPGRDRGVGRARLEGIPVVVRLAAEGEDAERRAELSVLAAVDHPGLARLVDHGSLPDGRGYLVRSWIEGRDLRDWSRDHDPEALGRMAARLAFALEHLHRHGFVHGDLKATNVVVREGVEGPEPVLTDFGLARMAGDAGPGVSGTLFHVAPEVLLGRPLTPAADLFALGATLHELLIGRRPSAREFYGRFPREDFFTATGTSPEELPPWARDVVASLLASDPAQRPPSAARLGRILSGRLGLELDRGEPGERLRWTPLRAREAWLESWWTRLAAEGRARGSLGVVSWLTLQAGEDARAFSEALSLQVALRGTRVHRLELEGELAGVRSAAALDAWARGLAGRRGGRVLVAALNPGEPWQARGLTTLARALLQAAPTGREPASVLLVAVSEDTPDEPELGWSLAEAPPVEVRGVEGFLLEGLAGGDSPKEGERIRTLAALLREAGRGTATGIDHALLALDRQGWLLVGEDRPRLRPGPLPPRLTLEDGERAVPEGDAATLWACLQVGGGVEALAELAQLTGLDEEALAGTLDCLVKSGHVAVHRQAGDRTRVEALRSADAGWAAGLAPSTWTELNSRRAQRLDASGASPWRPLPHHHAAGRADDEALLAACRRLREDGLAELALELLDTGEQLARGRGGRLPDVLIAERALAWCALGQADRAQAAIEPLRAREEARAQALVARVEGRVAGLRHALAQALEHYETARRLDPQDGGEALLSKALLLFEMRRQEELEQLLADLDELPAGSVSRRVANNLRAVDAMARFRRGEIEAARQRLREQAAEAHAEGHTARGASLEINLATLERRAGALDAALLHADRAVGLYTEAGHLAGLAQARALRGGTLREVGRLSEAERELAEALAVRERLGERSGTAAVRGMLGLVHADRGHARAAVQELERAAREVRGVGRSHDALLLEARAREVRARLGLTLERAPGAAEAERAAEGDPRTLLACARLSWLEEDESAAREHATRARALAASLGLAGVVEEADLLLALLAGERLERPEGGARTLAEQDRELRALLGSAPLDVDALRALAAHLEQVGRDDRAARAWIAVAVRTTDEGPAAAAAEHARGRLEACSAGTSAGERARLEQTLLGLPDPWPEDLVAWRQRSSDDTQLEAEVIELLDINRRLLAQEDLRSLLGAIVEQALAVSGAQRGFLVLEEEGELSVDTALDSRRGGIEESDVELSGSALRQALESMRPVRVSNAVDDPLLGAAPSVIALELRSILCVPFRVDKARRGVIYVDHRLREAAFDERAERMLRLLADQAALAILQVRRLEEIRRLHRELSKRVVAVESDLKTARRELTEAGLPLPAGGLVGSTEPIRAVRHLLERAAPSKLAVLVSGESGTGKELAARALHELSPRASGPFVSESCAALPPSLIEAELFGARKGAYTGADRDREGLFERAHGGTLFLDEIGELPLDLQAKLLRVLETSEVRRLGDERSRRVDFRLVAATNRDLEEEVAAGRFRSDLYYRLKGLQVHMPALDERVEDLPALVDHFLRLQEREDGMRRRIAPPVLARLMRRPWPGNVRELANEVARLCVLSEGDLVDPDLVGAPAERASSADALGTQGLTLAELERAAIERALADAGGDKGEAARRLGISRAKIYQRLKEWREQG